VAIDVVRTNFDIPFFSYNVLMVSCFQQPLFLISCSFKSLTFCCFLVYQLVIPLSTQWMIMHGCYHSLIITRFFFTICILFSFEILWNEIKLEICPSLLVIWHKVMKQKFQASVFREYFFKDDIFAWWNIWISIILPLP
jgi:hypothetical protein